MEPSPHHKPVWCQSAHTHLRPDGRTYTIRLLRGVVRSSGLAAARVIRCLFSIAVNSVPSTGKSLMSLKSSVKISLDGWIMCSSLLRGVWELLIRKTGFYAFTGSYRHISTIFSKSHNTYIYIFIYINILTYLLWLLWKIVNTCR